MSIYYCGVGARLTPYEVCIKMTNIAKQLRSKGYILRTGGAVGADAAFALGAEKDAEIFLPWEQYNQDRDTFHNEAIVYKGVCNDALELAERFHPAYDTLSNGAKKLMARNGYQVLGPNLDDPVHFVICWTPSESHSGTSQTIRIARHNHVPVYNLYDTDIYDTIENLIEDGELSSSD